MTKKQVLKHTVSYEEGLIEALKDPEEARAYLEVALDECEASGKTDGLLLALRDVAQAQGALVHLNDFTLNKLDRIEVFFISKL